MGLMCYISRTSQGNQQIFVLCSSSKFPSNSGISFTLTWESAQSPKALWWEALLCTHMIWQTHSWMLCTQCTFLTRPILNNNAHWYVLICQERPDNTIHLWGSLAALLNHCFVNGISCFPSQTQRYWPAVIICSHCFFLLYKGPQKFTPTVQRRVQLYN